MGLAKQWEQQVLRPRGRTSLWLEQSEGGVRGPCSLTIHPWQSPPNSPVSLSSTDMYALGHAIYFSYLSGLFFLHQLHDDGDFLPSGLPVPCSASKA